MVLKNERKFLIKGGKVLKKGGWIPKKKEQVLN